MRCPSSCFFRLLSFIVCKLCVLLYTGPIESFTICAPPSSLANDDLILLEMLSNLAAAANNTSTSALSSAKAALRDLIILSPKNEDLLVLRPFPRFRTRTLRWKGKCCRYKETDGRPFSSKKKPARYSV